MKTGLVSISFRKLSVAEVASLCVEAGLQGVEWGGDVHCPHGDVNVARETARITAGSGLSVAAYGSYYKVGESEGAGLAFGKVLDSAVALGAPVIRVWAGAKASADADSAYRAKVAGDLNRICGMAAKAGVGVSLEYHINTLTDCVDSALKLMADAPEALCQWQPGPFDSKEAKDESLRRLVGPRLANIHVYEWIPGPERTLERRPLAEGADSWRGWLKTASAGCPNCKWALLEFVKDDDPRQLIPDARALRSILPL